MKKLCFGSFATVLVKCKAPTTTQKQLVGTMLLSVNNLYDIRTDDGTTSALAIGHVNLSDDVIVNAKVIDPATVAAYFKENLLQLLDLNRRATMILALKDIIAHDSEITDDRELELVNKLTKAEIITRDTFVFEDFLAGLFLYIAIYTSNNKREKDVREITDTYIKNFDARRNEISFVPSYGRGNTGNTGILDDVPFDTSNQDTLLLLEVDNKCPLCSARLMVRNGKGKVVKRYKITQIFPDNVNTDLYLVFSKHSPMLIDYNHSDNLIALCTDCSYDYLSEPTEKEFLNLQTTKKALQQRSKLRQGMDDVGLEPEICDVVYGMINISKAGEMAELRMDALKIRQKIEPINKLLIDSITDDVMHYYSYIQSLFADIDGKSSGTFVRIAMEVRLAYQKIKNEGLSQETVFEYMVDWLKGKLPDGQKNEMAISAVVSFFVQNCEVFDEIS